MPAPIASKLDATQVLPHAFDDATGTLRTSATVVSGAAEVIIDQADDSIAIYGNDGSSNRIIRTDTSGRIEVTESSATVTYAEVLSVPAASRTLVASFTAASARKLKNIMASGSNIAMYEVQVNASVIAKKRSMHGAGLNLDFDFSNGLSLVASDIVRVYVTHDRSGTGDFNSSIVVV